MARPSSTSSMPAALNRSASRLMPRTRSTRSATRFTVVAQSIFSSATTMPYASATRTSRMRRAVLASTRVGTQPVFTHVPPVRLASSTATLAPSSAARSAAAVPAGPAPITTMSKWEVAPGSASAVAVVGLSAAVIGLLSAGRSVAADMALLGVVGLSSTLPRQARKPLGYAAAVAALARRRRSQLRRKRPRRSTTGPQAAPHALRPELRTSTTG